MGVIWHFANSENEGCELQCRMLHQIIDQRLPPAGLVSESVATLVKSYAVVSSDGDEVSYLLSPWSR